MSTRFRALRVYVDPRVLSILFLGFSSGVPLLLVFSTLSAWLQESGVDKTTIGFFSWASSAYALKFLWSPVVDRMPLPILTSWLGRRRGWLLLAQVATAAGIVGMGMTDPATNLFRTALWAVILAFASATQDIVVDAYRVEILDEERLGAGAANYVFGYRIAMLAAGAGALIIADYATWSLAYMAMAALMAVGIVTTLLNPEPRESVTRETVARERKVEAFLARTTLPGPLRSAAAWLYGAVVCPFAEFATRPGWILILAFVAFYKYGDALLGTMANPFYLELGFTKTQIAIVSKGFGLAMTLLGTFFGGSMVAKWGINRSLLVAGILQGASNLVFALQAWVGASVGMLYVTISVENFTGGLATAAFVAYLSSLCNVAYTASQYALLTSFMSAARTFFASGGGWLADHVSWVSFFILTTIAAVPGMALLLVMMIKFPPRAIPPTTELLEEPD